jgi:hypothetical protein
VFDEAVSEKAADAAGAEDEIVHGMRCEWCGKKGRTRQ